MTSAAAQRAEAADGDVDDDGDDDVDGNVDGGAN
jgi:hypothetical protein